ncbi:MAG: regulatory protein RecX [Candidatus Zixiibacteriota bacterium]
MAQIEKIQRKGKNYLLLFAHGAEILATSRVLDQFGLKSGMKIEAEVIDAIKNESELQRAEEYLVYLLSRRSYSSGHLAAKMYEKGYRREIIAAMIEKFEERGLIDDAAFAREFAESIIRNKPAGKNYIIGCLQQKYVPAELAKAVAAELFENVDETALALRLLKSRWGYFSKFELETARRKAYNYLSRRSIGYRAAKTAFEQMLKEVG